MHQYFPGSLTGCSQQKLGNYLQGNHEDGHFGLSCGGAKVASQVQTAGLAENPEQKEGIRIDEVGRPELAMLAERGVNIIASS